MKRVQRYSGWLPILLLLAVTACTSLQEQEQEPDPEQTLQSEHWVVGYDHQGVRSLVSPLDPFGANVLAPSSLLDTQVRFRLQEEGEWQSIFKRLGSTYRPFEHEPTYARSFTEESDLVRYTDYKPGMPFAMEQTFRLDGEVLEWDIVLENRMQYEVILGDVAIQIPPSPHMETTQEGLFEGRWIHSPHISEEGSFLIYRRLSGKPPFLMVTVKPGTGLEYLDESGFYIHSGYSGNEAESGTWRLPHTYNRLAPSGSEGDRLEYGFRMQWAESYDELRSILVEHDLIDVRVVPGMTVPDGEEARFSLHTRTSIESVTAEFPDQTEIRHLGESLPGHQIYSVRFDRLGENMLTITFDGGRQTHLEFFASEPIETLIDKRNRFIVENQQHRDPDVWYDGLYSIWDMKNSVLRGPDNVDVYTGWSGYMVAADDPVLGIAPYLASVNALDPVPEQIESIEYHIENFVWDGLQRTDMDDPYPWAIYGVPNWKVARDTLARAEIENRRLDRIKAWRAYDYPHIFMLYYHMHQIADRYPDLVTFRDADGYLEMMWQTARVFFEYPYEIYPWYDIYKWGYMNEMLIPEIADLLEEKGRREEADWLRHEWEIKARWFIQDDPYPYRSEFPVDRTAFESTYALARYAADVGGLEAADDLWYDKNVDVSRSYDRMTREDALNFMEEQHLANLAVRGWLEPSYYQMGADYFIGDGNRMMSYMSRMGGWSILQYGLEYAEEPHDWLQLGYNSHINSLSLMNTGTAETDYGYWFPGEQNDGAVGWAFVRFKETYAWSQNEVRGSARYDGEANLTLAALTRTAATILTEDPVFGWFAYGGRLTESAAAFEVLPRDGVRTRFWLVDDDHRLGLQLARDGWSASRPIVVSRDRNQIDLIVENRTGTEHSNRLELEVRAGEAEWEVLFDGTALQPENRGVRSLYHFDVTGAEHELTLQRGDR